MRSKDYKRLSIKEFEEKLEKVGIKDYDAFIDKMVKLLLFGVRTSDDKGHREDIRFRMEPATLALAQSLREKLGLINYRNSSDVHRSIYAMGLYMLALLVTEDDKTLKKICSSLDKMATLSGHAVIQEVNNDFEKLKTNLKFSNLPETVKLLEEAGISQAKISQILQKHVNN
jgi:hypothetical protein